jgi:acetyl esterase/lipase
MANKHNEEYSRELLTEAVANSLSIAGLLRFLEIPMAGGTHAHISHKIKQLGIDTSHFPGQAHIRNQPSARRLAPEQFLVVRSSEPRRPEPRILRRALRESGVAYACAACGIDAEWNGKPDSRIPTFAGKFKNKKGP